VDFVGLFLSSLLKMHGPKNKILSPSPYQNCTFTGIKSLPQIWDN